MVSKKKSKNDQSEITEEEKQILKQYYNEQHAPHVLERAERVEQQEEEQQQPEELIQPPPQQEIKQKRQISDSQRESLAKARVIALLKKKELKEISEKKKIIQTMKKEGKK